MAIERLTGRGHKTPTRLSEGASELAAEAREDARTVVGRPTDTPVEPRDSDPFEVAAPCCGKPFTVRRSPSGAILCACFAHGVEGVAAALGIPVWKYLNDPVSWLRPFEIGTRGPRARRAHHPPSEAKVLAWRRFLADNPDALRRLRNERGLTPATVETFEIGWDPVREGYTLPIRDSAGELVNVSWRAPKGRGLNLPSSRKRKLTRLGRGIEDGGLPLYPEPLPRGAALLVEGEWDALVARQHGVPTFTGLVGNKWNPAWDGYARGRTIPVAYDVGAEEGAAETVERLRAAGARAAWVVPLALPNEGDDLVDWFVKYGRSVNDLLRSIRRARRSVGRA